MNYLFCLTLFLFGCDAFAMPLRCYADKKIASTPEFMFKISATESPNTFVIGLTPINKDRVALYGRGTLLDGEVRLNFVEDGTLTGYLLLNLSGPNALKGTFKHSYLGYSGALVTCQDLTPHI